MMRLIKIITYNESTGYIDSSILPLNNLVYVQSFKEKINHAILNDTEDYKYNVFMRFYHGYDYIFHFSTPLKLKNFIDKLNQALGLSDGEIQIYNYGDSDPEVVFDAQAT